MTTFSQLDTLYANYVDQRKGYGFTYLSQYEWVQLGWADQAVKHFNETGYMPGQYIGGTPCQ